MQPNQRPSDKEIELEVKKQVRANPKLYNASDLAVKRQNYSRDVASSVDLEKHANGPMSVN